MAEIAMLHDVSKCTGCRGCQVACKQWKNLPAEKTPFDGAYQSHKDLSYKTYDIIRMREDMTDGQFRWVFAKFQCMHCGDAACVKACPEKALWKDASGAVKHSDDKCIGCGYCVMNCSFGVPHINPETKKSTKCNLCIDRIEHGMIPACAQTCTANAILFGTREEMVKVAQERLQVLKEKYPNACLYGVDKSDGVGGTSMLYVFYDKPSVFGFPDEPKVPSTVPVWKDFIQPGGKILMGAAAVVVAGSVVMNNVLGGSKSHGEGK